MFSLRSLFLSKPDFLKSAYDGVLLISLSPPSTPLYFFTPRRTPRQLFSKCPESFGFSTDHPHATYINVLKFSIFGGGGQLTGNLENNCKE